MFLKKSCICVVFGFLKVGILSTGHKKRGVLIEGFACALDLVSDLVSE